MSNNTRFVSPASQEIFSNSVGTVQGDPNRPLAERSGYLLVRLLNSKVFDPASPVFVGNTMALWADNSPITFGDLAETTNIRPDGSSGTHYPNVFGLTHAEGSAAIDYLKACSDKPKASGGYKKNAASQQKVSAPVQPPVAAQPDIAAMVAAGVAETLKAMGIEPPKAAPEVVIAAEVHAGDVLKIMNAEGEILVLQISEDGKRLRKTIA